MHIYYANDMGICWYYAIPGEGVRLVLFDRIKVVLVYLDISKCQCVYAHVYIKVVPVESVHTPSICFR